NPSSSQLGRQPVPLRYVVLDGERAPVRSGRGPVSEPIISDRYASAPYAPHLERAAGEAQPRVDCEPLRMARPAGERGTDGGGSGLQCVDTETLRLEPADGEEGGAVDEEGTEVVVPDQGGWTLDRESATVRFSPESDQVRETAPIFGTGGDGEGAEAAPALL